MKKGFVAMILALVAVVAFSSRAFADPGFIIHKIDFGQWVGGLIKTTTLFSTESKDYSIAVRVDGDVKDLVFYGKLANGVEVVDLSTFEAVGKTNLKNQDLKDDFDAIKGSAMLVWETDRPDVGPPYAEPLVASNCEMLPDQVHFRCHGFNTGAAGGKSAKDLLDELKASEDPDTFSVRAALLNGAPSPEVTIAVLTADVVDADEDGVPDDLDACVTAATFDDPSAECVVDTDADGVADVDDPCPSDPTDACLQPEDSDGDGVADVDDACPSDPEDACVNANAGAGDTTPVGPVADDGGSCSLNPAAGGNPIAFLVIAFGLLPLAWRRKV